MSELYPEQDQDSEQESQKYQEYHRESTKLDHILELNKDIDNIFGRPRLIPTLESIPEFRPISSKQKNIIKNPNYKDLKILYGLFCFLIFIDIIFINRFCITLLIYNGFNMISDLTGDKLVEFISK
jgi:hypothetical protein